MNYSVIQLLSICLQGNCYLSQSRHFKDCDTTIEEWNQIQFSDVKEKRSGYERQNICTSVHKWFEYLYKANVKQISVCYTKDNETDSFVRETSGFIGGGGRWMLQTSTNERSDLWEADWTVKSNGSEDQDIWDITYLRIAKDFIPPNIDLPSLYRCKINLKSILPRISKFAHTNNLSNFGDIFDKSLAHLDYDTDLPINDYIKLPLDLISNERKTLLYCSFQAWVFGGMGSWNDHSFVSNDLQNEYIKLSNELFDELHLAILSAIKGINYIQLDSKQEVALTDNKTKSKWWQFWL
ncbi:MAG: hypothetical protein KC646_07495 [Candidatus Cloacimonetes bacterium]|nr:hypothetical protein [Candidatus Cloacimonadota bacterium]